MRYLWIVLVCLAGCRVPGTVAPVATVAPQLAATASGGGSVTMTATTRSTQATDASRLATAPKVEFGSARSVTVRTKSTTDAREHDLGAGWAGALRQWAGLGMALVAALLAVVVGLLLWAIHSNPPGTALENVVWRNVGLAVIVGGIVGAAVAAYVRCA